MFIARKTVTKFIGGFEVSHGEFLSLAVLIRDLMHAGRHVTVCVVHKYTVGVFPSEITYQDTDMRSPAGVNHRPCKNHTAPPRPRCGHLRSRS